MNGTAFKLGTFAKQDGAPFAAIVLGDNVVDLASAAARAKRAVSATSIDGLLQNWDADFAALQEIVAFLEKDGAKPGAASSPASAALPPVTRPGKMFYAAQNFQEHVDEMIRAGMSPKDDPKFPARNRPPRPICSSRRRAASPAPTTTSKSRAT